MVSSWPAFLRPFSPGQHIALCREWKKPFCRLSPHRQILCCSCLDDGSGVVKECWLLTDHLSLTTTCRLLSPPARAAMMDRASIAQPSPAQPPPPPSSLHPAGPLSVRPLVAAHCLIRQKKKKKEDRQVNTAAILFSAYPLSSLWGHLQFTSRFRQRIAVD